MSNTTEYQYVKKIEERKKNSQNGRIT